MIKKSKFFIISSWIILSRLFDLYCTYQFTPDLSKEANPLVSLLNFSGLWLVIIISFITLYVLYVYYKSEFVYNSIFPKQKGLSFEGFITCLAYGEPRKWKELLFRLPNSLNRFNNIMGHILPIIFSYVGLITTLMWLCISNQNFYYNYYYPEYVYFLLIFGTIIILYSWARLSYKKYQNQK